MDNSESYGIRYLDFSKTFDKVPQGTIVNLIKSWFSDRRRRFAINGCNSEWGQVISGVPQIPILGTLSFLIWIIWKVKYSSDTNNFLDESKIISLIRSNSDVIALQADFDWMNELTDRWQMPVTIKKRKILNVGRTTPRNRCMINNDALIG